MSEKLMVTVIGGSGFLGTSVCRLLRARGVSFEIVDLKESKEFPSETRVLDIRDFEALTFAITGDVIVHLAAVHRDDVQDNDEYYSVNVLGTQNVIRVAEQKKIRRIVFTSSVAVYGFAEPRTGEAGAIQPFNEYGRTKFLAEQALDGWLKASQDRSLAIIRPTVIFGPGNRGNVFNLLNQVASGRFLMIGNGLNIKSMAYVENVAEYILHIFDSGERFMLSNYVDDPQLDVNELILLARAKLLGKRGVGPRLPRRLGLSIAKVFDLIAYICRKTFTISSIRVQKFCSSSYFTSCAQADTGFVPRYTLKEGLEVTLEAEFVSPDPQRQIFYTE